jgi:phospholipid:diacylglycerol acyltransferase
MGFCLFLICRSELNDAILEIVAGEGQNVKEQFHSPIREIAKRIKWDGADDAPA